MSTSSGELVALLIEKVEDNQPIDRKLIIPIKREVDFTGDEVETMLEKALDGMCWQIDHGKPQAALEYAVLISYLRSVKQRRETAQKILA